MSDDIINLSWYQVNEHKAGVLTATCSYEMIAEATEKGIPVASMPLFMKVVHGYLQHGPLLANQRFIARRVGLDALQYAERMQLSDVCSVFQLARVVKDSRYYLYSDYLSRVMAAEEMPLSTILTPVSAVLYDWDSLADKLYTDLAQEYDATVAWQLKQAVRLQGAEYDT